MRSRCTLRILPSAAADHQTLDHGSEEGVLVAMVKRLASHDHHSKILRGADGLRGSTADIIKIYSTLDTPYMYVSAPKPSCR